MGSMHFDIANISINLDPRLDRNVIVNFAGTVITKSPLGLGEHGYCGFTNGTNLNFLGYELTIKEFLEK